MNANSKTFVSVFIFAILGAGTTVSGAVVHVDLVASRLEQNFSPGVFIPGLGSYGGQSNNVATFSDPVVQQITTSESFFEFYLMAPAGQVFSFTSTTGQRLGFGLNFHLNDGEAMSFSNRVEASILGADGGVVDSFEVRTRSAPSSFSGLTGIDGPMTFAGVMIRAELVTPPASGSFTVESGSIQFINTRLIGEMDPGPELFLVAIPEPAMPLLLLAAILPSILRRRG